jgi:hypothetical protein
MPNIQPCAKYGMYPALGYHQAAIVTSVDSKPAEELKKTSAEMESAPVPMGSDLPQGQ